jgi:hypothetical protein
MAVVADRAGKCLSSKTAVHRQYVLIDSWLADETGVT